MEHGDFRMATGRRSRKKVPAGPRTSPDFLETAKENKTMTDAAKECAEAVPAGKKPGFHRPGGRMIVLIVGVLIVLIYVAVIMIRASAMAAIRAGSNAELVALAKRMLPEVEYSGPAANPTELYNEAGQPIGRALFTLPWSEGIRGYNGPVPLVIVTGADGRIAGVAALPNREDAPYWSRVEAAGLLDVWNGLTPEAALSQSVDAVSRATYSSRGVIDSVRAALPHFDDKK
jgi:hypothetical protein